MKRYLTAGLLMFALAACTPSETDALRNQNTTLERQLETVTAERDAYKARLDAVRAALEGATPVTTPAAPAAPTPTTPPDPSATPVPTTPTPAPAPDSSTTPVPAPPAATETAARLKAYADNVLSAAQNFKAQAGSEPPTDCSSGYKAGDYSVEKIADALPECLVTTSGDGSYSVRLRDGSGQTLTVP